MKHEIHQLEATNRQLRDDAVYNQIEDLDPFLCSREELDLLLTTASTEFARGYLCGVSALRLNMSLSTGGTFGAPAMVEA